MAMAERLRLISTPDLGYRYQVVRADGLPEIGLTLFADHLQKSMSASSVPQYMRELLAFATWASADSVAAYHGWNLYSRAEQVRELVREYLTTEARCRLTVRPDLAGLRVTYVKATDGTKVNVRTLLAALKRLYDFLATHGRYLDRNPLLHEGAANAGNRVWEGYSRAIHAARGRNPMAAVSGVDERCNIRLLENYFRCNGNDWVPKTIDDRDFPCLVYIAGQKFGWGLRETCITRCLFESGARIAEVMGLNVLDWARSDFNNHLSASNKGSYGIRVKTLVVSGTTVKLLRRHFDDDVAGRRRADARSLRISDAATINKANPKELEGLPLFLNQRGRRMSATLFRDFYWKPALDAAGIDADPHQARHWFVTNALRNIDRTSTIPAERARRRQELIQYMAWRSGERTLSAYDHVQRAADFETRLSGIHREMRRREMEIARGSPDAEAGLVPRVRHEEAQLSPDLAFLLGEDHDGQ
jgi:hypothetical protein